MTTLDLITKDDLESFKKELFEKLEELNIHGPQRQPKKWLRSAEVRNLLNVSPGTLQNLRINGTLPFRKVGSILYYSYADISKLLGSEDNS